MDPWLEAVIRYELNDPLVRMAERLGLNPKKLGKLSNNRSERWKKPLKNFISDLYKERFKDEKLPPGGPIADALAKGKYVIIPPGVSEEEAVELVSKMWLPQGFRFLFTGTVPQGRSTAQWDKEIVRKYKISSRFVLECGPLRQPDENGGLRYVRYRSQYVLGGKARDKEFETPGGTSPIDINDEALRIGDSIISARKEDGKIVVYGQDEFFAKYFAVSDSPQKKGRLRIVNEKPKEQSRGGHTEG
jgi:hypothetical protein